MFGRWRTQRSERTQKWPRDCNYCPFLLASWSFARILAENLTLCRVADASACNMQKHSLENLDENNLFAFERFVPSSLQVVPRFRGGYSRDCSPRPSELMYSQETGVSSEIVPWSPLASSIPVHRQRHRFLFTVSVIDMSTRSHRTTQVFGFTSSCCILHALLSACPKLGVISKKLPRSCRMLGEKEVLMTCLFGVGAWYARQERAPPAKQCFEMFPTNR